VLCSKASKHRFEELKEEYENFISDINNKIYTYRKEVE
jgi:hypothetical protein